MAEAMPRMEAGFGWRHDWLPRADDGGQRITARLADREEEGKAATPQATSSRARAACTGRCKNDCRREREKKLRGAHQAKSHGGARGTSSPPHASTPSSRSCSGSPLFRDASTDCERERRGLDLEISYAISEGPRAVPPWTLAISSCRKVAEAAGVSVMCDDNSTLHRLLVV